MPTILISAANSDVCLSMLRIMKSHHIYRTWRIIGLAPDGMWPARAFFDDVIPVPFSKDPDYFESIMKAVQMTGADIFIPFSEAELTFFVSHSEKIKLIPARVLINPADILSAFLDKFETAEFLTKIGVMVPKTRVLSEIRTTDIPLLIKPRRSAGSKNMAIIRNEYQLKGFMQEKSENLMNYIAQELIDVPEDEYTCALWRMGGELRICMLWRRLQGGLTGVAKVVKVKAIEDMLKKLADHISGDLMLNVQLRLRGGIPYVFEINPRFSSTLMMRHKIGFQDFIWTLDYLNEHKKPPSWQIPEGHYIYRVSDEVIVNPESRV